MPKKAKFFALVLFMTSFAYADEVTSKIDLSQGYRREWLDFSIANPFNKSRISSKIKYKDMNVYVTRLAATLTKNDYFLKGIASYGDICSGKSEEYEFSFYRTARNFYQDVTAKMSGNYTADAALRFGKNFAFDYGITMSPRIGYSAYIQKLRLKSNNHPRIHGFGRGRVTNVRFVNQKKLSSRFRANWRAPELGLEIAQKLSDNLRLFANYTLLYPLYFKGKGKNSLAHRPSRYYSFTNTSIKSFGNIASIGGEYAFNQNWSLSFEYEFMKFYSRGGHQRVHNTGRFRRIKRAPMYEAQHLTSSEVRLSLGYAF